MIWIVVLLVILQSGFHWIFTPAIIASTNVFELRSFFILILFLMLWIFSANNNKKDFYD